MLNASPRMKQEMTIKRIILSKRQPPNLKKMLTRARFTMEETDSQPKIQRCKDTRCKSCHELQTGSEIRLGQKRERFEIKRKMNCSVTDFIYVITCMGRREQYIGESGDTLRHRTTVHRQQIMHPHYRKLYVSKHISLCAIAKNPIFKICPIFKLYRSDELFRKEKEHYFIGKYKPSLNRD